MASRDDVPLVLVTGASGFIGSHVTKLLLEEGYRVRGSVRKITEENNDKIKYLKDLCPNAKFELDLVEADLLKEDSWKDAVKGCMYVIHVASPFPNSIPSNADDIIKPAVDGTLAVLKACSESGTVKRVVITSSICAVYDPCTAIPKDNEETKTFTEDNWTAVDDPHLDTYGKSKVLAEKAAWDYVKELPENKKFDLSVVNPGMVFGPLLSKNMATSVELVKRLMDRSTPAVAKLIICFADVRDVSLAHVRAMTKPEAVGNRHIVASYTVWMKDIALILQKEFRPQGYHIPTMVAPNFFVWLNSFIEKTYRLVVPRLGRDYKYDNKRMVEVLEVTPIEMEKTIIDTAYSLIELGAVKKPKKSKKAKETEAVSASSKVNGEEKTEAEPAKELEPEDKEKMKAANETLQEVEVASN